MKRIYGRGTRTVELPFLMSCALYVLDRRGWVLGIRYPWRGIRFDLVVLADRMRGHVVLVEAKYRGDGRPVRPHEIRAFRDALTRAKAAETRHLLSGLFMTNSGFSREALELARASGIETVGNVPLLFRLARRARRRRSRA